jgi:hypothetical protein
LTILNWDKLWLYQVIQKLDIEFGIIFI